MVLRKVTLNIKLSLNIKLIHQIDICQQFLNEIGLNCF